MNLSAARALLKLPTAFTRAELEQAYQLAKEAWNPAKHAARDALKAKAEAVFPQLDGAKAALLELVGGKNPPRRLGNPPPARPLPAPLPRPASLPRPEPLVRAAREALSARASVPRVSGPGQGQAKARLAEATRAHARQLAPSSLRSLSSSRTSSASSADHAPPPLPVPGAVPLTLPVSALTVQPKLRQPAGNQGRKTQTQTQIRTPTSRPRAKPPAYGIEIEDKGGCLQAAIFKFGTPFAVLIVALMIMGAVRTFSRPSAAVRKQRQWDYTQRQDVAPTPAQTKPAGTPAREQRVSVTYPPGNAGLKVEMVLPAKWTAQAASNTTNADGARDLFLYRESGTWQHSLRVSAQPRGEGMGGHAWSWKLGSFQTNATLPPEMYQPLIDAGATEVEARKVLIGGLEGMDVSYEITQKPQSTTYISVKRQFIFPVAEHLFTADATFREEFSTNNRAFVRTSARMARDEHTALFQSIRVSKAGVAR